MTYPLSTPEAEMYHSSLPLTLRGRYILSTVDVREKLRVLPGVDTVLRDPAAAGLVQSLGRPRAVEAVRAAVEALRRGILSGERPDVSPAAVVELARELAAAERPGLRRVINATGVVLHTNLGRAPLADAAARAAAEVSRRYSNLEYDLKAGRRGSRYAHAVGLLRILTGAEDALVLNNCAAATLLALAAVAAGGEVPVSRGQLIEIGGGFRIPEILELSGAKLREVGTTNRTRLADYERAIGEETRAVLWVHSSNFATVGFTESAGIRELASLGAPVIADLGSGALVPVADEPQVPEAVAAGAAVVTFSGDKLLGGPQAGVAVGQTEYIDRMRRHPLARALRPDKLCLAALEATLRLYADPERARREVPALRMLHTGPEELEERARKLAARVAAAAPELEVSVVPSTGRSGGGTLPLHEVPSRAVRLAGRPPEELAAALRAAEPPVIGRIREDALLLDVLTLLPGEDELVAEALDAG
jgi:L-seryl-tRNA(Ser) seleniumtransferase